MAAELSTLIILFLDWKPEKYAYCFLGCVNSKQQFNAEVLKSFEFTMQRYTKKNFTIKINGKNTTFLAGNEKNQ